MYECSCCGLRFNEPSEEYEWEEHFGFPCKRYYSACPRCGGGYEELPEDIEDESKPR